MQTCHSHCHFPVVVHPEDWDLQGYCCASLEKKKAMLPIASYTIFLTLITMHIFYLQANHQPISKRELMLRWSKLVAALLKIKTNLCMDQFPICHVYWLLLLCLTLIINILPDRMTKHQKIIIKLKQTESIEQEYLNDYPRVCKWFVFIKYFF